MKDRDASRHPGPFRIMRMDSEIAGLLVAVGFLVMGFVNLQAVGCALGHGIEDAGLIARLRSSLTLVVEDLLIAEEACSRISLERLEGQDVLFPDARKDLNERTEAATMLSDCFSRMATESGEEEIDWEQMRTSIQPAVDRQVASWVNLARMSMLLAFGKAEAWREPADRLLNASPHD